LRTKQLFTFILLVGLSLNLVSQTYIQSSGRARDQEYYKSQNIIPIFWLKSDTIEENNAFGVEAKFSNAKRKISLPDELLYTSRNGYGYLFNGSANNSFAKGYILFIITDNSRSIKPSLLFIDRNNDFDLSNDGPPDTLKHTHKEKYIFLSNPDQPQGKHIIKLSRFKYTTQFKYIQLTDSHFTKHNGSKDYMGTYYSFKEQRLNVLAANYKGKGDSFTLGFKDENCNGLFAEAGIDKIMIADYLTEEFSAPIFTIGTDGDALVETTGHMYKLTKLNERNASSFYIQEVFDAPFSFQLNEDEKVPKFKYLIADSGKAKKRKLCKHRKKMTYVYFTNSYAENFQNDTATLRLIHNKYSQEINILFMNSGDIPRQSKKIAVLGNLPYYCGISNAEIDESWHIKTKPAGFFLKKKLKLHTAGMTPKELLTYLETNHGRK
jgi:hypothetical protein